MRLDQILDSETTRQFRLYAASVPWLRTIPQNERLEKAIRYALRDWMESIGEGHIEDALGVPNAALDEMPVPCDLSRVN